MYAKVYEVCVEVCAGKKSDDKYGLLDLYIILFLGIIVMFNINC
jgi:hypothetical protein